MRASIQFIFKCKKLNIKREYYCTIDLAPPDLPSKQQFRSNIRLPFFHHKLARDDHRVGNKAPSLRHILLALPHEIGKRHNLMVESIAIWLPNLPPIERYGTQQMTHKHHMELCAKSPVQDNLAVAGRKSLRLLTSHSCKFFLSSFLLELKVEILLLSSSYFAWILKFKE